MWQRPVTLIEVAGAAWTDLAHYSVTFSDFLETSYMNPTRRQAMIDAEPPLIDDTKRDAFVGGAAEHLTR